MKRQPKTTAKSGAPKLERIWKQIAALRYICSGTLMHKTKRCGRSSCACAHDESARHGPYYEWHRREDGRQVHSMVPNDVGPLFEQASENYRKLRSLLREWEKESARAMLTKSRRKPRKRKKLTAKSHATRPHKLPDSSHARRRTEWALPQHLYPNQSFKGI